MSIYDQDTDPSSPDAMRQTPEPPLRPGAALGAPPTQQSPRAATTDPGVGPPSPPGRASGVVVPPSNRQPVPASAAVADRPKDSVELLLEGMGGPRPDRTKTMPQTAGEGAAAYHAEHAVRAGRTARDESRKVLVDTVRLPAATEDESFELRSSLEATYVLPDRQKRRVVIATIAGLLVVVVISAYLDRAPRRAATAQPSQAVPAAVQSPPQPQPAVPGIQTAPVETTPESPAEPAPAATAAAPAEAASTPPAAVASRPRSASRPKAADVGEFKTAF